MFKKIIRQFSRPPSPGDLAREIVWDTRRDDNLHFLCMGRAVLNQDIEALRAFGNFRYSSIKASRFELGMSSIYPRQYHQQTFFHAAFDNLPAPERRKGIAYAAEFLEKARKIHDFHGVIVANSDYWQDKPLMVACQETGLPFIVLNRENYVQDLERNLLNKRIQDANFSFAGDLMCVASNQCRKILLDTGAYEKNQVALTGWPRLDRYGTSEKGSKIDKKNVTLMSYHEKLYLAPKNFMQVLDIFLSVAKKLSCKYRFVIKVKKRSHAQKLISLRPYLLFSPIHIEWNALSSEILKNSRVVIGFNTTGVLEAMLSDADVIVPWWGDAVQPRENLLISAHNPADREMFAFPNSKQEFRETLEKFLAADHCHVPETLRRKHLDNYLFIPEQGASKAFEKAVETLLHEKYPHMLGAKMR